MRIVLYGKTVRSSCEFAYSDQPSSSERSVFGSVLVTPLNLYSLLKSEKRFQAADDC